MGRATRITCTECRLRTYCNVNRAKYPHSTCLRKSVGTSIVILLLRLRKVELRRLRLRKAELRRLRLFQQQRLQSVQRCHVAYDSKSAIRQLFALFGSITIVIRWTSVDNIEKLSCFRIKDDWTTRYS